MNKTAKCAVCKEPTQADEITTCFMCESNVCSQCAQIEGQHISGTQYMCETCIGRAYRCRNCND